MAARKVMAELVSQYIDQVLSGGQGAAAYAAVFAGYRSELEPLLHMVARIRSDLVRLEPRPVFREGLRCRLVVAAGSQPAPSQAVGRRLPAPSREVIIGAAAVGSLVSAAAIFMVARSRAQAARRAA